MSARIAARPPHGEEEVRGRYLDFLNNEMFKTLKATSTNARALQRAKKKHRTSLTNKDSSRPLPRFIFFYFNTTSDFCCRLSSFRPSSTMA